MFLLSEIVSSNYNKANNSTEASPFVTTVMRRCTRALHFQSCLSLCKMKGPWVCFAFTGYSVGPCPHHLDTLDTGSALTSARDGF